MPIREYHRPQTLEAALALLARPQVMTVPLGGGTRLNAPDYQHAHYPDDFAVVDVQALGLEAVSTDGAFIEIGAALSLQGLIDTPGLPEGLLQAARLETTFNLRQVATVAGTLAAADGRSPLATAMLALDARLAVLPAQDPPGEALRLGDLLASPGVSQAGGRLPRRLITRITIPAAARLAYEYVARTPADRPIVCAAVAQWPSGRTRVCLGGFGAAPALAMDGPEPAGADAAGRAAYSQAGDEWASAEYRLEMAGVLTNRCLAALHSQGG